MENNIDANRNFFCFPDGKIVIKRGDDSSSEYLQECRNNGFCLVRRIENSENGYIYEFC